MPTNIIELLKKQLPKTESTLKPNTTLHHINPPANFNRRPFYTNIFKESQNNRLFKFSTLLWPLAAIYFTKKIIFDNEKNMTSKDREQALKEVMNNLHLNANEQDSLIKTLVLNNQHVFQSSHSTGRWLLNELKKINESFSDPKNSYYHRMNEQDRIIFFKTISSVYPELSQVEPSALVAEMVVNKLYKRVQKQYDVKQKQEFDQHMHAFLRR